MQNEKQRKIIIVLIVIMIAMAGVIAYFLLHDEKQETAIIVETNEELEKTEETGDISVTISPSVVVEENTMQNLNFYNLNEGRDLQLKIKVGDKYIYESPLVKTGTKIQADVIDTSALSKGENEVLGEIYSYDLEGNERGHHNVKFIIYY